jgi:hypothetical protein
MRVSENVDEEIGASFAASSLVSPRTHPCNKAVTFFTPSRTFTRFVPAHSWERARRRGIVVQSANVAQLCGPGHVGFVSVCECNAACRAQRREIVEEKSMMVHRVDRTVEWRYICAIVSVLDERVRCRIVYINCERTSSMNMLLECWRSSLGHMPITLAAAAAGVVSGQENHSGTWSLHI